MARVQVLLATCNGEAYLGALLGSVLAQRGVQVALLARDDASTDGTWALLQRYAAQDATIRAIRGKRLGPTRNFLTLLAAAPPDHAYYALCDQDDVWRPDKLARAVAHLCALPADVPALYASRLLVTDAALTPLWLPPPLRRPLGLANALVETPLRGCTMVLNAALRARLVAVRPRWVCSHDWWLYLVAAALGTVVFDPAPTLLYRQHGANRRGATRGLPATLPSRLRQFLAWGGRQPVRRQAAELQRLYSHLLSPGRARLLERFLADDGRFGAHLGRALAPSVYRQAPAENAILRALLLLNRLQLG